MTGVELLVLHELHKVIMPLPAGHRVLFKELERQDRLGSADVRVFLTITPEVVLAVEGWNATGHRDARASQDDDVLTSDEVLCGLFCRHLLRLGLVLLHVLETIFDSA